MITEHIFFYTIHTTTYNYTVFFLFYTVTVYFFSLQLYAYLFLVRTTTTVSATRWPLILLPFAFVSGKKDKPRLSLIISQHLSRYHYTRRRN